MIKQPKRDEFEIGENEVTHKPTGAWFSAYPGRPEIANRRVVDPEDYAMLDIEQIAAVLLRERLEDR
jgi:hypothetical protein